MQSSLLSMIEPAKEIIFDKEDSRPVFHIITAAVDLEKLQLNIGPMCTIECDPGHDDAFIQQILGVANACDVPVYPNTPSLAGELARHHRHVMLNGFYLPVKGEQLLFRLFRSVGEKTGTLQHLTQMDVTELHSASDWVLIREAVLAESAKWEEVGKILGGLQLAIDELTASLETAERNEAKLQGCLTANPILFGVEYRRVLPKHKLGAEYEMDYALERVSGLVDLVEIEASNLALYTQKGNPSQHLVDAEQQVLDWLAWIERHHPYARASLPTISAPIGYVVIGRTADLPEADRERLKRRNATFRGCMEILTYDDLLCKARNLLRVLQGRYDSEAGS